MKTWTVSILCSLAAAVPAEANRKSKPALPPAPFSTVVIDAGHGGHDLGGIPRQKIPEKGVALDVARRLGKSLERAGFRTVLTRSSDTFLSLGQRVAIANANPNAILVSVHFNSSTHSSPRGSESYYCSTQSGPIAALVQARLAVAGRTPNRGVKRARFYVLRESRIRAVLVECGFLTNPQDASLATTSSHRQRLADAICVGIQRYRARCQSSASR